MKNVLIVLRDVSDLELRKFLESFDVWIANSLKNDNSIDKVWLTREVSPFVGELTTFVPIGETLQEQLENALSLVDEHHDECSDRGLWSSIEMLIPESSCVRVPDVSDWPGVAASFFPGCVVLRRELG